jgi:hypothetical protein
VPKMVRILGTSSRERVRSTTVSKTRCIVAPSAKIRPPPCRVGEERARLRVRG